MTRSNRIAILLLASFCFPFVASVNGQPTPPLLPDEIFFPLKNSCALIGKPADFTTPEQLAKFKIDTPLYIWTGVCPNGVADGMGVLGKQEDLAKIQGYRTEYILGRATGKMIRPSEVAGGNVTVYRVGTRLVNVANVADPYAPRWAEFGKGYTTTLRMPGRGGVRTVQQTCFVDQKAFRGCDLNNDFQVYGVTVLADGDFRGVDQWCPNPRSPIGCETLWNEKSAAIIADIKAFVAEAEKKIADDRRQYTELTLPWIQRQQATKLADLAEAKQVVARQAIARDKDKMVAAEEQQARDEADARETLRLAQEKEKAAKAYTASLGKLNAGVLFTLAEKQRMENQPDKAREAYQLLIVKYSSNPLVAIAAQQMLKLPPPAAPVAKPEPIVAKTPAMPTKKLTRDDDLEDLGATIGVKKK